MINKYSEESEKQLATCDERLQKVFRAVLPEFDHSVIEGFRDEMAQEKAFVEGRSTKHWPFGEHNKKPSKAVDVMAYPFSWADLDGKNGTGMQLSAISKQCLFIGYVLGRAKSLGVKLRSGVDWDRDWDIAEHTFRDLPHFEVVE